jgi:tRNA uridine 5-carboxymethylaminomethyl modification enzyme
VLIDDLVTKGTEEPYRMLTSRCEHRLLLRHDTAARRLAPIGRRLGLIGETRWRALSERWAREDSELDRLRNERLPLSEAVRDRFAETGIAVPEEPQLLCALLRRQGVTWDLLAELAPPRTPLSREEIAWVEAEIRYEGYIEHEERAAKRLSRMDAVLIPAEFDYRSIVGLLAESRQKLEMVRPRTLGQGARIAGVTPTDIQLIAFTLEARGRQRREERSS